ncbi:MAG TPA: hypothetical protein VEC99_17195 [Clostridia bacterium]|nr:hypothetical protein [Clostridia bacterium]
MSGYQHAAYAAALFEYGGPRHLSACDGWILVSPIPDRPWFDARGCYPLFSCKNWANLHADLDSMHDLVSLVLVADPFGNHTRGDLERCFPELCRPYKEHYVIDLGRPLPELLGGPHARNIRKALQQVQVEQCGSPQQFAREWTALYAALVERHQIKGLSDFSDATLEKQLGVPGTVAFRAISEGVTIGMILWYVQGDVGYYHLAAYNDFGYELRASFALFARSIEFFSNRLRFLNLGAGAGVYNSSEDGLTRFKRGWSTGTRTAYLCGRVFDHQKYDQLVRAKCGLATDYFPPYRKGEVR